jgi:hypothetical protein
VAGGIGWQHSLDAIAKGVPGLSESLPPRRDVLGREITRGDSAWWNPFAGKEGSTNPVDLELSKLAATIKTPPRQIAGAVVGPHDYDEMLRNATQTKLFGGKTRNLEEEMASLVTSPQWHADTTATDGGIALHTKRVQGLIDSAYSYGEQAFLRDHPEFQSKVIQQYTDRAAVLKRHPVN